MPNEARQEGSTGDGVRVTTIEGGIRRVVLLILATVAVVLAVGLVVATRTTERDATPEGRTMALAPGDQAPGDPGAARGTGTAGVPPERATGAGTRPRAEPRRMSDEALLAALQRAEARGTIEVGEPGDQGGLAAFPPPGTKPIKRGIVVPEGFALPPGYVRHYQAMDDGRRLPAVLMFHPDFELVDANGQVVPLPEDRLVPPELAPEGLAIDLLDVPEPEIELVEPPGGGRVRSSAP